MTTLVLVGQKIVPFGLPASLRRIRKRFIHANRYGLVSIVLCALILGAVVTYVASLVILFHHGLRIQRASDAITRLEQGILKDEIALQQSDANFLTIHQDVLSTMEKTSSINYIPQNHAAALAPSADAGQ